MKKVLFVGNGYDRALGLETDYISWLNKYTNYEEFYQYLIIKNSPQMYKTIFKDNGWYDFDNEEDFIYKESENVWIQYFKFLIYMKNVKIPLIALKNFKGSNILDGFLCGNGNWIDLEKIIEETIFNNKVNIISEIIKLKTGNKPNDEEILLQDFKEAKQLLVDYLKQQGHKINPDRANYVEYAPYIYNGLKYNEYDEIINFNYTKSIEYKDTENKVWKIHGNLSDEEKIIFGANNKHYIQSNSNNDIRINDQFKNTYYEYTKMFQLQSLNSVRDFAFDTENIESVSIIGHSISEQDYNYFFTLLESNPKMILEYLYYSWHKPDENNELKKKSNKEDGLKQMFNMLEHYEKYSGKNISYTMNFEGRIKFKEIKVPNIISIKKGRKKENIIVDDEKQLDLICNAINYSGDKELFIKAMYYYSKAFYDDNIQIEYNKELITVPYDVKDNKLILNCNRKYLYNKFTSRKVEKANHPYVDYRDELILSNYNIISFPINLVDLLNEIIMTYKGEVEKKNTKIHYNGKLLLEVDSSKKTKLRVQYSTEHCHVGSSDMSDILKKYNKDEFEFSPSKK